MGPKPGLVLEALALLVRPEQVAYQAVLLVGDPGLPVDQGKVGLNDRFLEPPGRR
jgi:hypothetical protein